MPSAHLHRYYSLRWCMGTCLLAFPRPSPGSQDAHLWPWPWVRAGMSLLLETLCWQDDLAETFSRRCKPDTRDGVKVPPPFAPKQLENHWSAASFKGITDEIQRPYQLMKAQDSSRKSWGVYSSIAVTSRGSPSASLRNRGCWRNTCCQTPDQLLKASVNPKHLKS